MRFLWKRRKNLTNSYNTVKALCSGELTEKKSKFTAYVCPVSGEEDAVSFVDKIKRQNHDARHNCYAYRLANGKEKFSDDGEPSGTAGAPMLSVLRSFGVCDTAVVVTRYFGGVLLGTAGLVRAYSGVVREVLSGQDLVEMALCQNLTVTVAYNMVSKIQYELSKKNVVKTDIEYAENVTFSIWVAKPSDFEKVADFSAGEKTFLALP